MGNWTWWCLIERQNAEDDLEVENQKGKEGDGEEGGRGSWEADEKEKVLFAVNMI
jgi:hypothetical protein